MGEGDTMAGDWIKMRINLDTDPRVLEMSELLEISELHVVGCLWKVWAWADSHTLDGNAIRVTDVTLDRFTRVTGFCDALRKVGWLEGRGNSLSFPRFAEHNGQTAKKRAETKERVAKHRNEKHVTDVTQNVLPEKRREEKSLEVSKDTSCDEQSSPPSNDSGFVFATQTGPWHLPEKKLAEYVATYGFDVRPELLKAAQWLRDNKSRRPRAPVGMKKFLTSWLNRVDSRKPPSSQLGGKVGVDDKLKAELERARKIREDRKRGEVSNLS
jgi:hypothetical protein